ncbi:MAG: Zn-dependent hydrolase [Ignavibacteria bacterium]|nr:MAG: Zn-dependent hydrolase [Ignavibacteria bacterium]
MISRRNFLAAFGLGVLAPGAVLAQAQERKKFPFSFLFHGGETVPAPFRPDPKSWDDSTITAAWIGHATVLINFYGTKIITDPVFSERAGPSFFRLGTFGPKRLVSPALGIDELPPLDLILISHAHFDHLDIPSLRRLGKNIPIVTAKNTGDIFDVLGQKSVRELDWGEAVTEGDLEIEGLRVNHFGWRFPWEKDRSKGDKDGRSFNGYLISKKGRHIVFGGDTAYHERFKDLGEQNIPIDLAILPIGAYDPWIYVHANPEQAVAMANHMRANSILPVHWHTFMLSNEPVDEPIERLRQAVAQHSPSIAVDMIGKTWKLDA